MLHVRSDAASVVCKGLIYCLGGNTGEEGHCSVEAIDPKVLMGDEQSEGGIGWFEVASMKHVRSGLACEVINDLIYAVGGSNNGVQLNSIER